MQHSDLQWAVRVGKVILGSAVLLTFAAPVRAAEPSGAPVTFAKDVAPIFQNKCQTCHRPDSIAPMSLISYDEVRPWARSIKTRVASRQMPPWHLDKTVGIQHFANDASLSDRQIDTIVKWVDAGAPLGDAKDMPAPIKWPTENRWEFAPQFGQPDLIVKSPAWHMPAAVAGRLVQADRGHGPDGTALGPGDRDSPGDAERPPHHAPRARAPEAGRRRRSVEDERRFGRLGRRVVHGVGGRQAGRAAPSEHGQAHAAGLEDHLRHPLPRGRRRHHRLGGAGHLLLPEGAGPQVPDAPRQLRFDPGRQGSARHRAELHHGDLGHPRDETRRPHRKLPAAHAPARQGDADGGDPARRHARARSAT